MTKHFTLFTWAVIALVLSCGIAVNAEEPDVEETTESPIADMALVDSPIHIIEGGMGGKQQTLPDSAQPHTIADFIIHPLIALKPRVQEEPIGEGKQAETTTTPAPWQLFGFSPGQGLGLGSQVSSLAGTVTNWLGNRIQLPGLIDTPVGESTTTTTSTTTTPRPDVVVRVQHRTSTRKPLIQINDQSRPHRFSNNNLYDSDEYDEDDYDDDFNNNDDYDDENEYDSEEDNDTRDEDEDEEEEEDSKPVRKRRPSQSSANKKKKSSQKKRGSSKDRKRPQQESEEESDDDAENDDNDVDDNDDNDVEDDDEDNQDFYYNTNNNNHHGSTKRSQNQQGFIQLSQQSLLNQIRQLTRGQTPAEVGSAIRKSQATSTTSKRRPQATLIINRNGQTVYIAPELMEAAQGGNKVPQYPMYTTSNIQTNKRPVVGYPQPPLTVPLRRKGKPTQYITIPWSQLGISPPNSQLVSVTEGIQSQPLILNIPQSALDAMQQSPKSGRRKPIITSEAVPLLAEASLMDVFKPPQIPPARTPSATKVSKRISQSMSPVIIATKSKQRIRPGTIVEKAPDMDSFNSQMNGDEEHMSSDDGSDNQFIVVGDDAESGFGRQAYPIVGEARQYHPLNPYFNLFQNRPYNARNGRQLQDAEVPASESVTESQAEVTQSVEPAAQVEPLPESPEPAMEPAKKTPIVQSADVQQIPVQVVTSEPEVAKAPAAEAKPEQTKTE